MSERRRTYLEELGMEYIGEYSLTNDDGTVDIGTYSRILILTSSYRVFSKSSSFDSSMLGSLAAHVVLINGGNSATLCYIGSGSNFKLEYVSYSGSTLTWTFNYGSNNYGISTDFSCKVSIFSF